MDGDTSFEFLFDAIFEFSFDVSSEDKEDEAGFDASSKFRR